MKGGQITIFIILGLIIVAGIIIIFLFLGQTKVKAPKESELSSAIKGCTKEAVEETSFKILRNGGVINPKRTVRYLGEDYNYLCYTTGYYERCYNLFPNLERTIEEEIKADTMDDVQACFNSFREELESRGLSLSWEATNYSIKLLPGKISIILNKKINVKSGDTSQNYEDFSFSILSPLYDLTNVAMEIVNSESEYCNFEYTKYMGLNPQFDIKRTDYDSNKIYRIIDRKSLHEFKFAVRSCVSPVMGR